MRINELVEKAHKRARVDYNEYHICPDCGKAVDDPVVGCDCN